jgi:hypothetical protein
VKGVKGVKSILEGAFVVVVLVILAFGVYGWLRREIPASTARKHGGAIQDCRLLEVDDQRYWSCNASENVVITVPCTRCEDPPKWLKP